MWHRFNWDTAQTGGGDDEDATYIMSHSPVCKDGTVPTGIHCRTTDPGLVAWNMASQTINVPCSLTRGIVCLNSENSGQCEDYEVCPFSHEIPLRQENACRMNDMCLVAQILSIAQLKREDGTAGYVLSDRCNFTAKARQYRILHALSLRHHHTVQSLHRPLCRQHLQV